MFLLFSRIHTSPSPSRIYTWIYALMTTRTEFAMQIENWIFLKTLLHFLEENLWHDRKMENSYAYVHVICNEYIEQGWYYIEPDTASNISWSRYTCITRGSWIVMQKSEYRIFEFRVKEDLRIYCASRGGYLNHNKRNI